MTKKEKRQLGRESASFPNAGHKAGKRKRGTSVLKRKPRTNTLVTTYKLVNEHGETIARVKTLNRKVDN